MPSLYAFHLNNILLRRTLAKFRCGSLPINIHIGRKQGIPLQGRTCRFCTLNQIDDELHFLLICPYTSDIRIRYLPRYQDANSDGITFKYLLSHTICLCIPLTKYIIAFLAKRADHDARYNWLHYAFIAIYMCVIIYFL